MSETSRAPDRRQQLVAAMLGIVAERGLDALSVREVAAAAGVSIGTVQHWFRSKDAMLAGALEEVVRQVRDRVEAVPLGGAPRDNLRRVLSELLPLDDERAAEARVQLAFAARAATAPPLAALQEQILDELRSGLAEAFRTAGQSAGVAATSATIALAATDGLAQHAVSSGSTLTPRDQHVALDTLLDVLLAQPA